MNTRALSLVMGLLLLGGAPVLASGRGISVSLIREQRRGSALIEVRNPGDRTGTYTVNVFGTDGQEITGYTASPRTFALGRGRSRRVRLTNLPPDSKLCASVEASSSLALQSCAPPTRQ